MPKVYIPNKGGHDYSDAERYGTIVYVTKGEVNRYSITAQYRRWLEELKDSESEDKILICGLTTLCSIGVALLALKHGKVNMLVWRKDRYIERSLLMEVPSNDSPT